MDKNDNNSRKCSKIQSTNARNGNSVGKFGTSNIYIHHRSLSWLETDTVIQSGEAKLLL